MVHVNNVCKKMTIKTIQPCVSYPTAHPLKRTRIFLSLCVQHLSPLSLSPPGKLLPNGDLLPVPVPHLFPTIQVPTMAAGSAANSAPARYVVLLLLLRARATHFFPNSDDLRWERI